jgi:hypothetical protein
MGHATDHVISIDHLQPGDGIPVWHHFIHRQLMSEQVHSEMKCQQVVRILFHPIFDNSLSERSSP